MKNLTQFTTLPYYLYYHPDLINLIIIRGPAMRDQYSLRILHSWGFVGHRVGCLTHSLSLTIK
ncbi:MAG: hypothetical protein RBG13Loki_1724 [Promethearchaeota archaeon CR_4]|nr:MAG: hypothetical protein RBG13Loki_1724 [Candidatus Lokiarchaeota archaeon CR_4]